MVRFTFRPLFLLQHDQTRSDRVGAEISNSPVPGIEPQIIQPVVCCYTDWALPPGGTLTISWLYWVKMSQLLPKPAPQTFATFNVIIRLSFVRITLRALYLRTKPISYWSRRVPHGQPNHGHVCSCACGHTRAAWRSRGGAILLHNRKVQGSDLCPETDVLRDY